MKLHYYPETDSLYIELKSSPGTEVREIVEGLAVDLDANGDVVGFDIEHASRKFDLSKVDFVGLAAQHRRHLLAGRGIWQIKEEIDLVRTERIAALGAQVLDQAFVPVVLLRAAQVTHDDEHAKCRDGRRQHQQEC